MDLSAAPPCPGRRCLRLAVVTETYAPEVNGVAITLQRFVAGLRERGHQIQLVRPRQSGLERAAATPDYAEVLTRGMPIPLYPDLKMGLPSKALLLKAWRQRRPELVHIVTEGPLGWSALQAARELGIPVCSDFRTNFHNYSRHYRIGWLSRFIVAYLRGFHNRTLLTLVPTEQMRRELHARGFHNLQVVSRGVDTALFDPARRSAALRAQWQVAPGAPVVAYVGRLAAEKNLATLSLAFAAIRRRHPGARLLLVGDGPEAGRLGAGDPAVVLAGIQRGEALATHYASADLFLFPSLTETFGNVTLEAMASGLPIVAFDYAAAAEHIRHGTSGLLARFGDAEDFAARAVQLADRFAAGGERFSAIGRAARERAEGLAWGEIVKDLEGRLLGLLEAEAV